MPRKKTTPLSRELAKLANEAATLNGRMMHLAARVAIMEQNAQAREAAIKLGAIGEIDEAIRQQGGEQPEAGEEES